MKNLRLFLIATLLLVACKSFGQRVVALHSANGTTMFSGVNPFADAYNSALSGDTIFLPGGSFVSPTLIDKGLIIFGAGYHPDSTLVTNPTLITGVFTLGENADNLVVEGVQFANNVQSQSNTAQSQMTFKRCKFDGTINFIGNLTNPGNGNVFLECLILGGVYLNNTTNNNFFNSIIQSVMYYSSSNTFKNNIFLKNDGLLAGVENSEFSNNIFYSSIAEISISGVVGNIFNYNIFVNAVPNLGVTPISTGNYFGTPSDEIFINHSGSVFNYDSDFHLQSPEIFLGNDASEVGIFGGLFPFKAGAVPSNPHFISKTIAGTTNLAGQLPVQIKVGAQSH